MLDGKGFHRKAYDDIHKDLVELAKINFGNDVNLEETSALGKFIMVMAYELDSIWQDVEGSYYSGFISTARGVSLDRLASNLGMARYTESNAIVKLKFTGKAGYTIPIGFIVATDSDIQFTTTNEITIAPNGTVETEAMCLSSGIVGNVQPNTVTVIVNPDSNINSVTNEKEGYNGRELEKDVSFRNRIMDSIGNTAGGTIDSIIGTILKLDNVKSVAVIENNTELTDEGGRPPHSFETFVQGGDNQAIGNAIFEKKPIGIQSYGKVSATVKDILQNNHIIKFSRPSEVNIYVKARVTVNAEFTDINEIKKTVIGYIGGTDIDGTYYSGLVMGEDVIYSKLIGAISAIPGVIDVSLDLSTNNSLYKKENIIIEKNSVSMTDLSKITVEVVS